MHSYVKIVTQQNSCYEIHWNDCVRVCAPHTTCLCYYRTDSFWYSRGEYRGCQTGWMVAVNLYAMEIEYKNMETKTLHILEFIFTLEFSYRSNYSLVSSQHDDAESTFLFVVHTKQSKTNFKIRHYSAHILSVIDRQSTIFGWTK